jgi:hypothetical protein
MPSIVRENPDILTATSVGVLDGAGQIGGKPGTQIEALEN